MADRPKLKPRPPGPPPPDCLIDCIAAADIYRRHLGLKWGDLVQLTPGGLHPYDLDRAGYMVLIAALSERVGPHWVQSAPTSAVQLEMSLG